MIFLRGRRQRAQPFRMCILGGHAAAGDRGPQRIGNLLGARAGAQIRSLGRPLVINIRVILIWEVLGGHCEVLWRSLGRTLEVFQVSLGSVFQHVRPTGWLPTTFDPCIGIGNQTLTVYQKPPGRGRIHFIRICTTWSRGFETGVTQNKNLDGTPRPRKSRITTSR